MMIYQVLDEQNNLVKEFNSVEKALQNAENLTLWSSEHYFHVEIAHLEEA